MKEIGNSIYKLEEIIRKLFYKLFRETALKASLGSCGNNVHISEKCNIKGNKNIFIGNNVSIGPDSLLWSTKAKLRIDNNVVIGPRLSVITGDHRVDIIGKYIFEIKDNEKKDENDLDVTIEKDVWIGANVTILKGVTISEGCVIGAGSIVTKSTKPYGIYIGQPAKFFRTRFTEEEIVKHKSMLDRRK